MITVLLPSPSLDVTYLVDRVTVGAIHRPREVLRLPGGKGLNLARAARRLGAEVRVVAPLGGRIGDLVEQLAVAAGVAVIRVATASETRSCVTVAADSGPESGGDLTEFYEPSAPLDEAAVNAIAAALDALDASGGWTVLAGSVPSGLEPGVLLAMLRARAAAGDRIAIDTHGPSLAIIDELRPALVKVNRFEAAELLGAGEGVDALELASALRERTGGTVVVTDGADGAVAVNSEGSWRALPGEHTGAYPVGSGDSFLAGLIVALDRDASLPTALADATAAGAANAQQPGAAEFALPTYDEIRSRTRVVNA